MSLYEIQKKKIKNKEDVLLVIKVTNPNVGRDDSLAIELIKNYKDLLIDQKTKTRLLIDVSDVNVVNPVVVWNNIDKVLKLNQLTVKKVRCTGIIINNPTISFLLNQALEYSRGKLSAENMIPYKISYNKNDVLKYLIEF